MAAYFPELSPRFAAWLPSLDGHRVAVVGHARPDGDCIGAQVALARVLAARGIDVVCVNADPVPRRLQFLAKGMTFLRTDDVLPFVQSLTTVLVDCADQGRVGDRLAAAMPVPVGAIDHHLSNGGFATHNFVDVSSAATCEILSGLFLDNALPIDAATAQALYAGVLTDTGQFRFNSTTKKTFRLASELLERGAHPAQAGYEIYERESHGKLKLLQHFLSTLNFECDGRVCLGRLPVGIFEATQTTAEDTEGLVDYARCIDGVDVGVLIEERPDGTVKASLRGKDPSYRVDLVAAQFNGGGHACAAGLNLKKDTAGFYGRLVAAIARQIALADAQKVSS